MFFPLPPIWWTTVVITHFSEQVAEVRQRQTLLSFLCSSCSFLRPCLCCRWPDHGLCPSHEKNEVNRERQAGETRRTQEKHLDSHGLSCSSFVPLVLGFYRMFPTPPHTLEPTVLFLQAIGGWCLQGCPGPTALSY